MSQGKNDYEVLEKAQIKQGDILKNLDFFYVTRGESSDERNISFPYCVVLSQSCDLEQHYNCKNGVKEKCENNDEEVKDDCDKILDTILICPAYPLEMFLEGDHIKGKKMNDFESPKGRKSANEKLRKNEPLNRYHFLYNFEDIIPALVIDFKNFHTIPLEFIQNNLGDLYLLSLRDLYREKLSQRFANYLSRIGLPN
jgi:hypothetical protein